MASRSTRSFDGTQIWFSDSEGEGPVVVLLHGMGMTSRSNFERHFGDDGTGRIAAVVGIDARGHGRSERPVDAVAYRGDSHARDVMCVIDAIEADWVDAVGYSMGGLTAMRLLGSESRLRSVVVCGFGPQAFGGDFDWMHRCGECFVANDFAAHPEFKPFRAFARLDPVHDFNSIGAAMLGMEPTLAPCEPMHEVAVLVLNGGHDDGDDDAARLTALIPGAASGVVGSGDHGTAPSDPLFQEELLSFLQRRWST